MSSQPPALVIGGELNGLSVCRSLAQAGIETYVLVYTKRHSPAIWSRSATPIKTTTRHGAEMITTLRTIGLPEGTVLIITDELALFTISEHRNALAGKFRLHLPPHDMVMTLQDKVLFHKFAVANRLPVPNAVITGDETGLSAIQELRFPVVIKPADKRDFHLKGASFRAVLASNPERAEIACRNFLKTTQEVILQECIEGPDNNIYFCLFYRKDNITKAIFTGRKLASIPRGTGGTALCMEVAPCDLRSQLEDLTETFLRLSDYAGFGGIEYKWDALTGRFLIIEPTVGRTDWQEEIATLSGTNIPAIGYCQECDLPMPPGKRIPSVVWQGSYIDRIRVGLGVVPPKTTVVDGYWRCDDPMPALLHYPYEGIMLIRGALKRLVDRLPTIGEPSL
jgi:D-aspartate ligase